MDVNCTDVPGLNQSPPSAMALEVNTTDSQTGSPENKIKTDELDFDDSNIYNTTDGEPVNITTISANQVIKSLRKMLIPSYNLSVSDSDQFRADQD